MFSVGFVMDKGKNKTPDHFADDVWNVRIKNGGITVRPGYEQVYNGANSSYIQGITNNNNRLYIVQAGKLIEVNYTLDPVTVTDRGTITGLGSTAKVNFINYGTYTIILTGNSYPRVWDGTTLVQLTSSNVDVNTNPRFGARFAGFTVVNSELNKNAILISNPIGLATQTNAYDWNGAGADQITYDGNVLGLVGTMNNLRVFTSTTIEKMDKSNLSQVGDVAALYTIPLAKGQELMNENCIAAAGDVVFFLTKNKKIGVINYRATVAEPQLSMISDIDINSIDGFMIDILDDDQSGAFAMFDSVNNIVKFYMRSRESLKNDVCVVYDIQRDTWLKDNNKFYGCATVMNNYIYAGSVLDYSVYKEEFGTNDRGDGIQWYFETTDQVFGTPWQLKQFRGASIAGQINNLGKVRRQILVDDSIVFDKVINGADIAQNIGGLGIGGADIGGTPIGGDMYTYQTDLVDFERVIDWGSLRTTGKKIKMIFSDDSLNGNFVLDWLSLVIRARTRENIADKM